MNKKLLALVLLIYTQNGRSEGSELITTHGGWVWPRAAIESCTNGFVFFRYQLDEQFDVSNFEIIESSPPGLFDEATRKNAEMYQYKEMYEGDRKEASLEYIVDDNCEPVTHNNSLNSEAGKAGAA